MSHTLTRILQKVSGKDLDLLIHDPDDHTFEQIRLKAHSFQMLVSSCAQLWNNTKQMEQVISTNKYFNMIYVRSISAQAFLRVYSIIMNLQEMGVKKPEILTLFNQLLNEKEKITGSEFPARSSELTIHLSQVDPERTDQVGSRMASLAKVGAMLGEVRTPTGFVITDAGYQSFLRHNNLQDEINRLLQTLEVTSMTDLYILSSQLQILIIKAQIPPDLEKAIMKAYRQLEMETGYRGIKVVLRPSTVIPDRNFALESLIPDESNVGEELLFRAYKEVVARKYSVPAMNYRMRRGLKEEDLPVCVGCLDMINTNVSGSVNFIKSQDSGPDHMIIRAVPGMDASITQGITRPDIWKISLDKPLILHKSISEKKIRYTFFLSEEGLNLIPVPRQQSRRPSLTNKQVLELAGIAAFMKKRLGPVGKIRWALDSHDEFAVLETIPLKESEVVDFFDQPQNSQTAGEPARGQTISTGRASGKVFIAEKNADLLEFPEKSVLVVREANSRWASLVPWSNAVITEKPGDPLGHLACMARDFKIPALFGVDRATSIFTAQQMVTVDGESKRAWPCSDEKETDNERRNKGHPLRGTPVFQALESVLKITGSLSQTYPLQEKNVRQLSLQDIAHLSHLRATSSLVDIAMANIDKRDPLYAQPGSWHVWNLNKPAPTAIIRHDNLNKISGAPLRAFIEGTEIGGGLNFISRKEPSLTRRFFYTAFNAYALYNPIFSRPAHIMFTDKFAHICFGCANLGIMIQAALNTYNPENLIFFLIKKHKSGHLPKDLGLEKTLNEKGFFTKNEKSHFLARKSGDDHELTRSMIIFSGAFFARISKIKTSRQALPNLEHLAREMMLRISHTSKNNS
jgi:phosphohistidine swiveling domain-containing protein